MLPPTLANSSHLLHVEGIKEIQQICARTGLILLLLCLITRIKVLPESCNILWKFDEKLLTKFKMTSTSKMYGITAVIWCWKFQLRASIISFPTKFGPCYTNDPKLMDKILDC